MQDTGPSSYVPSGADVFRFSTPTKAAEALAAVNAEYKRHCRTALEIAESSFDARQTAESILPATLT